MYLLPPHRCFPVGIRGSSTKVEDVPFALLNPTAYASSSRAGRTRHKTHTWHRQPSCFARLVTMLGEPLEFRSSFRSCTCKTELQELCIYVSKILTSIIVIRQLLLEVGGVILQLGVPRCTLRCERQRGSGFNSCRWVLANRTWRRKSTIVTRNGQLTTSCRQFI